MVGVLTWKADSLTTQQIALLRTRVSRKQLLSLVFGKTWDFTGSPEETCHDAKRWFLGKEVERACQRGKKRSRVSLIIGLITSRSTRRDEGCALVREIRVRSNVEYFAISIRLTYELISRFH